MRTRWIKCVLISLVITGFIGISAVSFAAEEQIELKVANYFGSAHHQSKVIVAWAKRVEQLGAGEILLTSKDADGTKAGYDIEMTKAVAEAVDIPVTASGGAGTLEHLYEAVVKAGASAVLAASIFHFGEISIPEAKKYLKEKGIEVNI